MVGRNLGLNSSLVITGYVNKDNRVFSLSLSICICKMKTITSTSKIVGLERDDKCKILAQWWAASIYYIHSFSPSFPLPSSPLLPSPPLSPSLFISLQLLLLSLKCPVWDWVEAWCKDQKTEARSWRSLYIFLRNAEIILHFIWRNWKSLTGK